jgi:hypothetical protein
MAKRHHLLGRRQPSCSPRGAPPSNSRRARRAAHGAPRSAGPSAGRRAWVTARYHPPAVALGARHTARHHPPNRRRPSRSRRGAERDAPPSRAAGPAPAKERGARRATICQRITVRRPSRLGRGASPSAGCWHCARTDFCCPKLGGNAWNQLSLGVSDGRMLNKNIHTKCGRISEFIQLYCIHFIDSPSVHLTPLDPSVDLTWHGDWANSSVGCL